MLASNRLALPYLAAAQSQKHVTVNEAFAQLDSAVHLRLAARDVSSPPVSPAEGDCYAVPPSATGAWAGKDGTVAAWRDGAWQFLSPVDGWRAYLAAEERMIVHRSGNWTEEQSLVTELSGLKRLGIGTAADEANPLSVKANAALLTARETGEAGTGDFRLSLNKQSAAHTGSLVFQTGYSGRAEIGLAGDDNLQVKVSANGSSWTTGIVVNAGTGAVGVGTNLLAGYGLRIMKPMTGNVSPIGVAYTGVVQADATSYPTGYMTILSTAAGAGAITGLRHYVATQAALGAGSSVNSQIGFFASSNLTGGANNFGFMSDLPASAGRWNFFANGTATNHFNGSVCIGTQSSPAKLTVAGVIAPSADNAYSIGTASLRASVIYAATGTINTSDLREKCDVEGSELGLDFVRLLKPRSYRWRIGGREEAVPAELDPIPSEGDVAEKREPVYRDRPGRRRHHGLVAQEVRAALDELGIADFGGHVLADAEDPDSRQGLRYDQFIAPLIKAVQELDRRMSNLESTS